MTARRAAALAALFAVSLASDLATKALALSRGTAMLNTGASFSIGSDLAHAGLISSALAALALAALAYAIPHARRSAGLILMAAGLTGNAVDRVRLGAAVDWFTLLGLSWNLADIWLCLGASAVIASALRARRSQQH